MHICLAAAQSPGLCSNLGGGGDAGAEEHQFGFSGAEGVGCCAPALAADRAVKIVTTSAIHARFALSMSTPSICEIRSPQFLLSSSEHCLDQDRRIQRCGSTTVQSVLLSDGSDSRRKRMRVIPVPAPRQFAALAATAAHSERFSSRLAFAAGGFQLPRAQHVAAIDVVARVGQKPPLYQCSTVAEC